jgi:hypothetical protein
VAAKWVLQNMQVAACRLGSMSKALELGSDDAQEEAETPLRYVLTP